MKIIIHSNGNPFNLNGGYNEQVRYLLKMFYDENHDVYFFNTGLSRDTNKVKVFNFDEIKVKFNKVPSNDIDDSHLEMFKNINYLCHTCNSTTTPHFIYTSKINEFIKLIDADHFITLCDVLIIEPDVKTINCPSTTWWPNHYNPPDSKSVNNLPLFSNIITLCPSVENIVKTINPKFNVSTCPHVIKSIGYQCDKNTSTTSLRQGFDIPIDSYVCLINAANSESSNRKAFDIAFMAFKNYLDINPNAFLYINSPSIIEQDEVVEFMYPKGHKPGQPLQLNHPQYGNIVIPNNNGEVQYEEGKIYTTIVKVKVPKSKPAINLLELIKIVGIPVDRFKLNNIVLSDGRLKQLYHCSDVLLACSKSEGFGLPILEAQVLGLPVITTEFLAMSDYTYFGISVKPCQMVINTCQLGRWAMPDVNGICQAIDTINKWDYETRNKLFTKAKFIIEHSMSFQSVKEHFLKVTGIENNSQHNQGLTLENIIKIRGVKQIHVIGNANDLPFGTLSNLNITLHGDQNDNLINSLRQTYPTFQVNKYQEGEEVSTCELLYLNSEDFTFDYLSKINSVYDKDTIFVSLDISDNIHSKLKTYLEKGNLELIGYINNNHHNLCFRMFKDIADDYKMLDIQQAYCFVADEKLLHKKLKTIKYNFPILEFVPIQKDDLLSLDNWRQTLINDGMLNPLINTIGADDVVEWISHRTLWTHFLNTNQKNMLVVLNLETLSSGLPLKVFDKKLIAYYKDNNTLNYYYITRDTAKELLDLTRPIKINFVKFIMLYLNNRENGDLIFNYTGTLPTKIDNTSESDDDDSEAKNPDNVDDDSAGQDDDDDNELDNSETLNQEEVEQEDNTHIDHGEIELKTVTEQIPIKSTDKGDDADADDENDETQGVTIDIEKSKDELEMRELQKKNYKPKIAIVTTVINPVYHHLMEKCLMSKQKYCDKHGYDFIIGGHEQLERGDSPLWVKYRLIQRYLPKYDYIFYSDADVIIMNDEVILEDIIKKYFKKETKLLLSIDSFLNIGTNTDKYCLNTSNFFVKNEIWSLGFLENVYNLIAFRKHSQGDQGAFNHLFYEDKENQENITVIGDLKLFNAIFPLPNNKNSLQVYSSTDFMIHFQKWKTPYLTSLHVNQTLLLTNDIEDEIIDDESLVNKYQVTDNQHKIRVVTFIKDLEELKSLTSLIRENSRIAKLYQIDFIYYLQKTEIVMESSDTFTTETDTSTTETDTSTTETDTTTTKKYQFVNPFNKINELLNEEPTKPIVVINQYSLLTNNCKYLSENINKLMENNDMVVLTNKQLVTVNKENHLSISLSTFTVKATDWSKKILNTLALSKAPPTQILSELYYTNDEVNDKVKLIYTNRLLKPSLFSEKETDLIYDAYHGSEYLIDLSNWNQITRPTIINMYVNINNNTSPINPLILNEEYQTIDNRVVRNINSCGLCEVANGDDWETYEWIHDIDHNYFIVNLITNIEKGSIKQLIPFKQINQNNKN